MRFELVDFLKGLAIVAVVALHFFAFSQVRLPYWLSWFLGLSVPLFIVLMSFNFANSFEARPGLKGYFKRRARRYLPFFVFAWFFSVFLGLFFELPLQFGERQLVGYFPLVGAGNYFLPMVFQFIVGFPLLYFLFKRLGRLSFPFFLVVEVNFEALAFYRLLPFAYITFEYNLLRFFLFIWLGFSLTKFDWLKRRFVLWPFNWLGKASYQLFIAQVLFFSDFGRLII